MSCTLNEPRALRPTEGLIFINVDISEAVCSSYDTGHQPHLATHANRLLEKCIKESNCVDLESLCILAGEQVGFFYISISWVLLFKKINDTLILGIRRPCGCNGAEL